MSRFLFVMPPLVGHVTPAVGVAEELRSRGHTVAWVAHKAVVGRMLGEDACVYPAGDRFLTEIVEHLPDRSRLKGLAALRFLWDRVLVPLAQDMADPVRQAVDAFEPDVVVSDQQAFAGGIVATGRGLPWAVSAATTTEMSDPLAFLPKVAEWRRQRLAKLFTDLGRTDLAECQFDPRFSPDLTLLYSTPELVGAIPLDPATTVFLGPVLPEWSRDVPFPWDWLDRRDRHVFVTLGTLSQEEGLRFLAAVVAAVADRPYGVVMVGETSGLPALPDNVLVRPFVPQHELLARVQAVVCHAGHNTVMGALSFGLPLVCAPMREDHPITADQVVRARAGRRISFWRTTPVAIAEAIDAVLTDPSYRAAAQRIADSFQVAGGGPAAADRLEELAAVRVH